MADLSNRGPMGQKQPKSGKMRKPMRKMSKKRAAHHASADGKAEMDHMSQVKMLPCVICGNPGPNDAHHCFHGRYGGRKRDGYHTIPLCKAHHQNGPDAVHTNKAAWAAKHGPDYSYLPMVKAQLGEET